MRWVAWWRKLPFSGRQRVGVWCPMMTASRRMSRASLEQFVAVQNWGSSEYCAVVLPHGVHPMKDTTIEPGEMPRGDYPLDWI